MMSIDNMKLIVVMATQLPIISYNIILLNITCLFIRPAPKIPPITACVMDIGMLN